ncbi:MAG: UPF0182 family protein [Cyanobacteria bacterium P01_H01_bin.15]
MATVGKFLTQRIKLIFWGLLGGFFLLEFLTRLGTWILWFREVGYLDAYLTRLTMQVGLAIFAIALSALFLLGNITLARRLAWVHEPESGQLTSVFNLARNRLPPLLQSPVIPLVPLLLLVGSLGLIALVMVGYFVQEGLALWRVDYTLPNLTPQVPAPFQMEAFLQTVFVEVPSEIWQIGAVAALVFVLLLQQGFWLRAIAWCMSLAFGLVLSGNWTRFLMYVHSSPFGREDPQFGIDIGFFIFRLPAIELLDFWLKGLFLYGLIGVTLVYLLSARSLSEGKFPGFSRSQLRHLYALGGGFLLAQGLSHWLARYELLFSSRGVVYGASYTDTQVQLPFETFAAIASVALGGWLLIKALTGYGKRNGAVVSQRPIRSLPFSVWPFISYLTIFGLGYLAILGVQSLVVQPNELYLEKRYIERSIAATRQAMKLEDIEVETFVPQAELTADNITPENQTIANIRVWDTRPILETNRQLQQIRLYYEFPDADIDRYTLKVQDPDGEVSTRRQQVIISARELDYNAVPEQGKTWINKHLFYTHGYGFTLSPVNEADASGLPFYYIKDIGSSTNAGALNVSGPGIRDSIPIENPRIYFGELTNNYIITNTLSPEFDFPSGDDNAYFFYDGSAGIGIGPLWRRLMFGWYLRDWQMLFTRNITSDSRLLLHRNINERVRAIAPFLRFDRDPYLVAARGEGFLSGADRPSSLYWVIDAYTSSNRYPYSDPGENRFNYIRNSVKIFIDAYNGRTQFYIADSSDPILQSWIKIFPNLFKPADALPKTLLSHIRYPQDLFNAQSERLLTYHMTDPQVFYNREDQWQIPQEIYGSESQAVKPYYLILRLPRGSQEEFILLHLYTPTDRSNLIAWLAARSDEQNYGKLFLYQFPKQKLVYGPNQIEALINQDPVISQQISLWNRDGSRAIQGNLLVIPIENSLLYVEPIYLEAEENSLPILARVVVVYDNQIVMAKTLMDALTAMFKQAETANALVRTVEQDPLPRAPNAASEEAIQ